MDNKKKKIIIICFVAGLIFGTFLIISGYKKPLTQEQIERCKFCSKGCGYEGGKCCSDRREFCHVCKGKGFNFKNY